MYGLHAFTCCSDWIIAYQFLNTEIQTWSTRQFDCDVYSLGVPDPIQCSSSNVHGSSVVTCDHTHHPRLIPSTTSWLNCTGWGSNDCTFKLGSGQSCLIDDRDRSTLNACLLDIELMGHTCKSRCPNTNVDFSKQSFFCWNCSFCQTKDVMTKLR